MKEEGYFSWYFLFSMIVIYFILYFTNQPLLITSINFFINVVIRIIPVLFVVFLIMILVNYFTPEVAAKYLGKTSGIKKWIAAIITGIISTGPIYMWYPMLKELKDKGVSYGFIATFLYTRAIKPPLIPLMVFYFGIKFTIVLTFVMIIFSVIQGIIIERIT
jgi:uncharacterized membrane protein YraQ (UPF0718 family)